MAIHITGYWDDAGSKTGPFAPGTTTDDTTPKLLGTLTSYTPGDSVFVLRDGITVGLAVITSSTPGGGAAWTYQDSGLVSGKTYSYTAVLFNTKTYIKEYTVNPCAITVNTAGDNSAPTQAVTLQIWDNLAPGTGLVASGSTINDDTPTIKGTLSAALQAGQSVHVYRNGVDIGQHVLVNGTNWQVDDGGMSSGSTYTYTAKVVNQYGQTSQPSNACTITLDTSNAILSPTQTLTLQIWDNLAPGTGLVASGSTINDDTPTIKGTLSAALQAGQSVHVYRNGVDIGQHVLVNGTNWQVDDGGMSSGSTYIYTAKVVNQYGLTSQPSNACTITLDTSNAILSPTQTLTLQVWDDLPPGIGQVVSGSTINDDTPIIKGMLSAVLLAGQSVHVYRNGVDIGVPVRVNGTNWEVEDGGMSSGSTYKYTARVLDRYGQMGLESNACTIKLDTSSNISTVRALMQPAPDDAAQARAGEPLDDPLAAQTVTLQVKDDVAPVTGWVVDGDTTNDDTPTLQGTLSVPLAAGESVHVFRNGEDWGQASVTGTHWTFQDFGLITGNHYTYTAKVMSAAGSGPESDSVTFVFDPIHVTMALQITEIIDDVAQLTGPIPNNGDTNDDAPLLKGTFASALNAGDYLVVVRDGSVELPVAADNVNNAAKTWSYQDSGLTDGAHTYTVRIVNAGGVTVLESDAWTINVDTAAPSAVATISAIENDTGTPGDFITADNTLLVKATVAGTVDAGEKVQISLNNGATWHDATLNGDEYQYDAQGTPLADGAYTFQARVIDAAGNIDPNKITSQAVVIDSTVPAAPVIDEVIDNRLHTLQFATGPIPNGGVTDDLTPTFKGSGAQAGSTVNLYDESGTLVGHTTADANGNWTYTLVLGAQNDRTMDPDDHIFAAKTFTATCVNARGTESDPSAAVTFTVDNEAPRLGVWISDVMDDVGPVQGKVVNVGTRDGSFRSYVGTTDDSAPVIKGMVFVENTPGVQTPAPARDGHGDLVYIFKGSNAGNGLLDSVTVDANGYWSYQDHNLCNGATYYYYVRLVNAAGVGTGQSNPLTLTIDASALLTQPTSIADNAKYYGTSGVDVIALSPTLIGKSAWVHGIGADTTGTTGQTVQHDMVMGGVSNDLVGITGTHFTSVSGGYGTDTLALEGSNLTLDLTALGYRVSGFERFDLNNQVNHANAGVSDPSGQFTALTQGNTLKLSLAEVLLQLDNPYYPIQHVTILGDTTSTVNLTDANWSSNGTQTIDGVSYDLWHNAAQGSNTVADLLIQQGVHVLHI